MMMICTKCKTELDKSCFGYRSTSAGKQILRRSCKDCNNKAQNVRNKSDHETVYGIYFQDELMYVGSTTVKFESRILKHKNACNCKNYDGIKLYQKLNEVGFDNVEFKILFTCEIGQSSLLEWKLCHEHNLMEKWNSISPINSRDERYCPDCATIKKVSEFHKNSNRTAGTQRVCKTCIKERYYDASTRVKATNID